MGVWVYTLQQVATEVGVTPRRLRSWIAKGLVRGPGQGCGAGCDRYSSEFVAAAKCVHQWLQRYPRGPLQNLRDELHPEDEDDDGR